MSTLNKVKELISTAHDEVLICRKWDIKRKDPHLLAAYGRLYPYSHRYYFEGNPSFLNDYNGVLDMSRYPIIMLRDGLATLAMFFLKNHTPPKGLNSLLMVNARFEPFVPETWKDRVVFYEVNFPKSQEPKKSLVLCTLAHHFLDYEDAKSSFERVKKELRGEPQFYAPVRERFMVQSVDETDYIQKGMMSLYAVFGASHHVETDNNKVMDLPLKAGDEIIDLHPDFLFVADNFLHHWFASKNVQVASSDVKGARESVDYALSLHHGISIFSAGSRLGESYSELAVNYKLSGLGPSPVKKEYIDFIKEALKKII